MNFKYGGHMGHQRLIKTIKGIGGGGGGEVTIGPTGPAGTNGATGPTGPAGPAGQNGTNGTNGTNGQTGPTGPAGQNGTNASITSGSITGTHIASKTITSSNIADETIVGDNIANDTIGLNKIEPFVGATLKKLLNPTGLITIYNKGSSSAFFNFRIYSKNDIGSYDLIYTFPTRLYPQGTAYCYYISNKFDYGINPILRIRILDNNVNDYACLQGASLADRSIAVDDSWFDFEDVFYDTNNIVFQVEQV